MKWIKHKVEIDKIDKFVTDYIVVIKNAAANLEHLYCVFQYKDDPIIHMTSIFDFIDKYSIIKSIGTIEKFYSYQVLNS